MESVQQSAKARSTPPVPANSVQSAARPSTPSYRLFANRPPDTQQVIEAVTKRSPFTSDYYTVRQEVQVPERVESVAVANFKTELCTTADGGRLVWSGSNRTTNHVNAGLIRNKTEK